MSTRTKQASRRTRRREGAVMVETLIAFPPLLFLFFVTLQLTEAFAAKLLVRRAAGAAVRAAVVVYSDDPDLYKDCDTGKSAGSGGGPGNACMLADVVRATRMVLGAGRGFELGMGQGAPSVQLSGDFSGHNLVTATVTASYNCYVPPVSLACGFDGRLDLTADASLPYQQAGYDY